MRCGNCKDSHQTAAEVKDCYGALRGSGGDQVAVAHATATPPGPKATDKQVAFLTKLAAERPVWADVENVHSDVIDRLTKSEASSFISQALEVKPELTGEKSQRAWPDVPAGYYAVASKTGNNDLDFFRVNRPDEGRWKGMTFVDRVIGGHPELPIRGAEGKAVLARIVEANPADAAVLYGREIGQCYVCNRSLTDELSRELGIGPVCRQG